MKNILRVREH